MANASEDGTVDLRYMTCLEMGGCGGEMKESRNRDEGSNDAGECYEMEFLSKLDGGVLGKVTLMARHRTSAAGDAVDRS